MAQHPGQGQLRQGLPPLLGDPVELPDLLEFLRRDVVWPQKAMRLRRPGIGGQAVEVFVGQQSLRQRGEYDAANAFLGEHVQQTLFDPAIEQAVARLMNQARRSQFAQQSRGLPRLLRRVGRDAHV